MEGIIRKIDTPGVYNSCFIHSILHGYKKYIYSSLEEKIKLAEQFRLEILDELQKENPSYETLESVITLVKNYFSIDKDPFNFIEFLRICYNFDTSFLESPEPIVLYNKEKYLYDDYIKYLKDYREYLINYQEKLSKLSIPRYKYSRPKSSMVSLTENKELESEYQEFIEELKKFYNFCEERNKENIKKFKEELESLISEENLYNPQNFGPKVIEAYLEKYPKIPKGTYHDLPFNCYYFTLSNGANLSRFDPLNGFDFNKIKYIITGKRFLSDADVIPMLPELLKVNIIILNIEEKQLINTYEFKDSKKVILINNSDNTHFDALCVQRQNEEGPYFATLLDPEDPLVIKILNSRNSKGKLPDDILIA